MGNPKQKWTSEEEEALKAGVQKHGTGKWKDIQKDPEFNPFLSSRSNIDLKDKWRNMTVSGSNPREKSRVPRARVNLDAPVPAPAPAPALTPSVSIPQTPNPAPIRRDPPPAATPIRRDPPAAATPIRRDPPPAAAPVRRDAAEAPPADDSSTGLSDAKTGTMYNAMIFEALSTDPNGLDASAIASFIEQRNEVPPNFRRSLTNRLRRMIHQGKLEKVQNCYKVKTDSPKEIIQPRQSQSPGIVTPGDTQEETETTAAHKIAEAQNKLYSAIDAVIESERISQMAEDQEEMLQLAKDIFDQCSDGAVFLMV